MPNIKSQIKRDGQNKKRTVKNRVLKSKIKTAEKRLIESVNSNNPEEANKNLSTLYKALDKAVKKSAIHKNFASNKKSKKSKLVNSLSASPGGAPENSVSTAEKTD